MVVPEDARRAESKITRSGQSWSSLHSWIFLAIVAIGLLIIGWQNRYFYIGPLGLGKAYRIDKLFGGIQEFDPGKGWIKAQIPSGPPPVSMMEPPTQSGAPPVSMNVPGNMQPPMANVPLPRPTVAMAEKTEPPSPPPPMSKDVDEEPAPAIAPPVKEPPKEEVKEPPKPPAELTEAEKLDAFKKAFPGYGIDEFQLAKDDLYPDWKKRIDPAGSWVEFLTVYGDFVQWWTDQGSPPEPGFKLWKDFTVKTLKR